MWTSMFQRSSAFSAEQWQEVLTRTRALDKALEELQPQQPSTSTADAVPPAATTVVAPQVFVRVRPLSGSEEADGEVILPELNTHTALRSAVQVQDVVGEEVASKLASSSLTDRFVAMAGRNGKAAIGGFDGVLGADASNQVVFDATLLRALPSVMHAGTTTLFCYGHTGTGKTHTSLGYGDEPGLYQLAAQNLIESMTRECAGLSASKLPVLSVRFLELHLGAAYDLLRNRTPLTLREGADGRLHVRASVNKLADGRVYAHTQATSLVHSGQELVDVMQSAIAQRVIGTSTVNERSSRSHAVLEIEIVNPDLLQARDQVAEAEAALVPVGKERDDWVMGIGRPELLRVLNDPEAGVKLVNTADEMGVEAWMTAHEEFCSRMLELQERVRAAEIAVETAQASQQAVVKQGPACLTGSLKLVDLAGNDMDHRDIAGSHNAQQRRESTQINSDLLAVKEVIRGFSKGTNPASLPFRNSKLTRLLKDGLVPPGPDGGQAVCIMVATVSPGTAAAQATVNTLHYASMATGVVQPPGEAAQRRAPSSKTAGTKPWQRKRANT